MHTYQEGASFGELALMYHRMSCHRPHRIGLQPPSRIGLQPPPHTLEGGGGDDGATGGTAATPRT